jgi:tetratricopeptide (TPR) repeat protein
MDRRSSMSAVLFLLLASCAYGQHVVDGGAVEEPSGKAATAAAPSKVGVTGLPPKPEIEHRVSLVESAIRDREATHASDVALARLYMQVGLWYEDLAVWNRAEADMEHAVFLFRRASATNDELATALSNLGSMHVARGKLRDGEKEEMEALRLRQETRDPLLIARSESDLATLYLAQHKLEKAKDSAERSLHEVTTNGRADTLDRTYARYTYSMALCASNHCPEAIPVLTEAVSDAKATMQPGDFPIGCGEFLLGFAYWKSGNSASAAQYMGEGTAAMKEQLGWGHPIYLNALGKYAQVLRENRRGEEAKVLQREIQRAEAVVDVRSLETKTSAFSFASLH